jgi:alpha-ketoglutarate-dependent taurine dioxygenase
MTTPITSRPLHSRTLGAMVFSEGPGAGGARGYEVGDLRRPRALARLARQVSEHGLAVFDGVADPAGLLAAAATVMTVVAHLDAGPDGLTTLTDLGPAGDRPGAAGFSDRALGPHTDRCGIPDPPGLLMLTCAAGVFTGGVSLLTDAAAVHADLAATAPQVLAAFHRPRSVLFGGEAGHLAAVFTSQVAATPRRCRMRLRLDELALFGPDLYQHLPTLTATIDRHTVGLTLTPGCGYLLDNHRWLHARTAYTGARTLFRSLGQPLPGTGIHTGIPLPEDAHPSCAQGLADDPLHTGDTPESNEDAEPHARQMR